MQSSQDTTQTHSVAFFTAHSLITYASGSTHARYYDLTASSVLLLEQQLYSYRKTTFHWVLIQLGCQDLQVSQKILHISILVFFPFLIHTNHLLNCYQESSICKI